MTRADRSMIIRQRFSLDAALADDEVTLPAGVAAAPIAGNEFDPVQSGHQAALHAARIECLVALEGTIHLDLPCFQACHRKPGKAVEQNLIREGSLHGDPAWQGRLA